MYIVQVKSNVPLTPSSQSESIPHGCISTCTPYTLQLLLTEAVLFLAHHPLPYNSRDAALHCKECLLQRSTFQCHASYMYNNFPLHAIMMKHTRVISYYVHASVSMPQYWEEY